MTKSSKRKRAEDTAISQSVTPAPSSVDAAPSSAKIPIAGSSKGLEASKGVVKQVKKAVKWRLFLRDFSTGREDEHSFYHHARLADLFRAAMITCKAAKGTVLHLAHSRENGREVDIWDQYDMDTLRRRAVDHPQTRMVVNVHSIASPPDSLTPVTQSQTTQSASISNSSQFTPQPSFKASEASKSAGPNAIVEPMSLIKTEISKKRKREVTPLQIQETIEEGLDRSRESSTPGQNKRDRRLQKRLSILAGGASPANVGLPSAALQTSTPLPQQPVTSDPTSDAVGTATLLSASDPNKKEKKKEKKKRKKELEQRNIALQTVSEVSLPDATLSSVNNSATHPIPSTSSEPKPLPSVSASITPPRPAKKARKKKETYGPGQISTEGQTPLPQAPIIPELAIPVVDVAPTPSTSASVAPPTSAAPPDVFTIPEPVPQPAKKTKKKKDKSADIIRPAIPETTIPSTSTTTPAPTPTLPPHAQSTPIISPPEIPVPHLSAPIIASAEPTTKKARKAKPRSSVLPTSTPDVPQVVRSQTATPTRFQEMSTSQAIMARYRETKAREEREAAERAAAEQQASAPVPEVDKQSVIAAQMEVDPAPVVEPKQKKRKEKKEKKEKKGSTEVTPVEEEVVAPAAVPEEVGMVVDVMPTAKAAAVNTPGEEVAPQAETLPAAGARSLRPRKSKNYQEVPVDDIFAQVELAEEEEEPISTAPIEDNPAPTEPQEVISAVNTAPVEAAPTPEVTSKEERKKEKKERKKREKKGVSEIPSIETMASTVPVETETDVDVEQASAATEAPSSSQPIEEEQPSRSQPKHQSPDLITSRLRDLSEEQREDEETAVPAVTEAVPEAESMKDIIETDAGDSGLPGVNFDQDNSGDSAPQGSGTTEQGREDEVVAAGEEKGDEDMRAEDEGSAGKEGDEDDKEKDAEIEEPSTALASQTNSPKSTSPASQAPPQLPQLTPAITESDIPLEGTSSMGGGLDQLPVDAVPEPEEEDVDMDKSSDSLDILEDDAGPDDVEEAEDGEEAEPVTLAEAAEQEDLAEDEIEQEEEEVGDEDPAEKDEDEGPREVEEQGEGDANQETAPELRSSSSQPRKSISPKVLPSSLPIPETQPAADVEQINVDEDTDLREEGTVDMSDVSHDVPVDSTPSEASLSDDVPEKTKEDGTSVIPVSISKTPRSKSVPVPILTPSQFQQLLPETTVEVGDIPEDVDTSEEEVDKIDDVEEDEAEDDDDDDDDDDESIILPPLSFITPRPLANTQSQSAHIEPSSSFAPSLNSLPMDLLRSGVSAFANFTGFGSTPQNSQFQNQSQSSSSNSQLPSLAQKPPSSGKWPDDINGNDSDSSSGSDSDSGSGSDSGSESDDNTGKKGGGGGGAVGKKGLKGRYVSASQKKKKIRTKGQPIGW